MLTRCSGLARLAAAAVLVTLAGAPAAAFSAEPAPPKLGITPMEQEGSWFEVELDAGGSVELLVELANHGDDQITIHTYAADAYTLVNGGLGVELRDGVVNGVSRWIDYPTTTVPLPADGAIQRSFTVTVPGDAEPGQYIAALVIQNDLATASDTGNVQVKQVHRQALAVNITVGTPVAGTLRIGDAEHIDTAQGSVMRVALENTGGRHLEPVGRLTVTDGSGVEVAALAVEPDTIYASMATHLELALGSRLDAGTYSAELTLRDAETGVEASQTAALEILEPEPTTAQLRIPGVGQMVDVTRRAGLPDTVWLVLPGLIVAVAAGVLWRRRRARARAEEPSVGIPVLVSPDREPMPAVQPPAARGATSPAAAAPVRVTPPPAPPRPAIRAEKTPPPPTSPRPPAVPGPARAPAGDRGPEPRTSLDGARPTATTVDLTGFTARGPRSAKKRTARAR